MSETELMPDIVERLRAPVTVERNDGIRLEAADIIWRLRHDLEEARAWNRRSPVAEGGGWRNAILEEAAMIAECAAYTASSFSADKQRGMEIAAGRIAEAIRDLKQPLPSPPVPSQEGASDTGDGSGASKASEPPPNPR